jgi:hypothetical protein
LLAAQFTTVGGARPAPFGFLGMAMPQKYFSHFLLKLATAVGQQVEAMPVGARGLGLDGLIKQMKPSFLL